jgi:hypothetical protein
MPAWAKVLLGIGCGLAVLLIAFGVGIFYYVNGHKDQWVAEGKKIHDEAAVYAASKTGSDCVDESIRRLSSCSGFVCEVRTRVFLDACLEAAAESPQLCDGVPSRSEIVQSARWSLAECARRGMQGSQPCSRLMQELQKHCDRRLHR